MPFTPFSLPYADVAEADCTKVHALVSKDDKRTVITALGSDSGIHALVIQHTYQRLANFIRTNGLNNYASSNPERIVNFLRDGTDSCAVVEAVAHPKPGRAAGGEQAAPRVPRKSAATGKGHS